LSLILGAMYLIEEVSQSPTESTMFLADMGVVERF